MVLVADWLLQSGIAQFRVPSGTNVAGSVRDGSMIVNAKERTIRTDRHPRITSSN